jgi:16S rRNA (guanine527-N7)-methyltransferase
MMLDRIEVKTCLKVNKNVDYKRQVDEMKTFQPCDAFPGILKAMEPRLPAPLTPLLRRYLALLDRWNRTHALTALPGNQRWEELLLDAAAILPFLEALPPGARVADLGTGMGCPAVVLALARPDLEVLAVDAAAKKLAFVRQAALELPVPNLKVVQGRLEDLTPLEADLGTAKALGSLSQLAGWWSRHGKAGAPFLALKGSEWADEPLPPGWAATPHPYALPTRGQRVVVALRPPGDRP